MDLGPVAGRLRPFPSEYGADLPEADGRGDKRPGIDRTPRWWPRDPERPTNAHRGDVLQSQRPGVDMAWAANQADIDGMARLTFTVGETGVLVTGEQSAVSAYTAQLRNLARMWGQPVTVSEVADVGAAAAAVTSRGVIGIVRSALPAKHGAAQAAPDDPRPDRKVLPGPVRGAQGRLPTGQV